MKKASSRSSDLRPDGDKAKRVYRTAVETIQKLDEISKQKKAYREVFMPDAINLRSRLQDYCEKLMFYDPLEYGRKAEELLWRKVYYDVIQLMKHNRKQMRPSSSLESAFRTHLAAATGYYHHLLCKIQAQYQLGLEGLIDFYYISDHKTYHKSARKTETEPKVKQWALKACHRCLIYLGDLARYQQDYDGTRSRVMSQRYYFQALALFPNLGMPHNQLGTLAGSRYYNVDAAYYYMRCLVTSSPFEGAHGNLMRLLEKNRHRYQDINNSSTRDLPPEQQRSKDIKRLMIRFMYLLDILLSKNSGLSSKVIQESCQNTLRDFELCMFYQPPHVTQPTESHETYANDEHALYIEDEMLIKIVIICIMSIHLLQKESNKKITAAIAFSLALFSHILNQVMIRLQTALYELENPRKVLKVDSSDEQEKTSDPGEEPRTPLAHSTQSDGSTMDEAKDGQNEKTNETGTTKECPQKKHKLKKLRQRRKRRHASGGSETSSQEAASDDSDLSEGGAPVDLCASESDPEEELQYLNNSALSDSDTDDNLMVSQELRPGFLAQAKDQPAVGLNSVPEMEEGQGDHEDRRDPDKMEDTMDHHDTLDTDGNNTTNNGLNSCSSNDVKSVNDNKTDSKENIATNITEYLKEFPVDSLNSSNFLSETLKFPALIKDDQPMTDAQIKAIAQGMKEVSVPPGFEKSVESHHVSEITRKMATFVIETDTDITQTDTDYSALTTESEVETETETEQELTPDGKKLEEHQLENTLKVITNEGLLCSIKLYCDWLQCNPHIIATCAKSSQSLWSRLSVLLNFLPLEKDLNKIAICKSTALMKIVSEAENRDWTPTQPLHEDVHLQQFLPLEDAQKDLVFDTQSRLDLTKEQEAILRILYLRRFGHYISKMKSINFTYHVEKELFCGPKQQTSEASTKDNSNTKNMVDAEARRNQLMKDMAQLRLQAEVSQLEGTLQSHDQVNLPPYLVPDATALCETLNLVKQLANSARFIIIIPIVVIDHLDILKKESSGARDCIRWLEAEIKKGNRYVRHQKSHEKICTLPLKNLKKKDRDAWRFVQIVDCAKYLSQQSSDCDPHGMICILTKYKMTSKDISIRLKQALYSAQQEGISVQSAVEFHAKWKDVWQAGKT